MMSKTLTLIPGNSLKIILLTVLFICGLFFVPVFAQAQSDLAKEMNQQTQAFAGTKGANLGTAKDPRKIAADIIKTLLGLLGIMLVAYLVYGGYLILLSQGNEEQVTKGKETIKNAVIGLILILSAYSIVRFAVRFATGDAAREDDYCQVLTDKTGHYNNDTLQENTVPFTPEQLKDCIKGD